MLGLSGAVFCRIRGNVAAFLDLKDLSGLIGFADFLVELVRERKGPKTSLGIKKEYVNVSDNASEEGSQPTVTSSPVGDLLEEHVCFLIFIEAKSKHASLYGMGHSSSHQH